MTANGLSEKKNSILEINDLCFAYPEEKKRALNHVSLHVEDGEFLVLCGKWMWKEYTSDTFKDSPNAAWKAKRRDSFSGSTNRGDE